MWLPEALSRVLNYLEAEVASESTEIWAEGINQGPGRVILGHQFNIVWLSSVSKVWLAKG